MGNKKFTLTGGYFLFTKGNVCKDFESNRYFIVLGFKGSQMECKYISRFRYWFICFKNWVKKVLKGEVNGKTRNS